MLGLKMLDITILCLTNDQTKTSGLSETVSTLEHTFKRLVLFDLASTCTLPVHSGSQLALEIAVGEDVVRQVSNELALGFQSIQLHALGHHWREGLVKVVVAKPQVAWRVS